MEIEKRDNYYQIRLGKGETKKEILRAIAVASFELSRPAGLGRLHFDGGSTLRPEEADRFIEEGEDGMSLSMDYVEGRQVKTFVRTADDGSLSFNGWSFERDRGNPEPVFQRANEILQSKHPVAALPVEATSTQNQFKGDSLTVRLKELGYKRLIGETDEQFRARIFPNLFNKDAILAGEFVFGKHEAEWREAERELYIRLLEQIPSDRLLQQFASDSIKLNRPKK